jgi:hypothetical protein
LTSLQFLGRAYAARAELTNGESFAIELPAAGIGRPDKPSS